MGKNLEDVFEVVKKAYNNKSMQIIRKTGVAFAGAVNPVAGIAATVVDELITGYNSFKLNLLIRGLSKDLNCEEKINKLYNYVTRSEENAIQIGNILKKVLASESPKVCVLLGVIVAKHLDNEQRFSREELIVCKAVENANDYDIDSFYDIMSKNMKDNGPENNRIEYIFNDKNDDSKEYEMTCSWGEYNRLFSMVPKDHYAASGKYKQLPSQYYIEKPAYILFDLIYEVKQILRY